MRCFSSPHGADRPTAEIVLVVPLLSGLLLLQTALRMKKKGKWTERKGVLTLEFHFHSNQYFGSPDRSGLKSGFILKIKPLGLVNKMKGVGENDN